MIDRFFVVLFQVVTLFLMMGVGFVLGRIQWITPAGTKEMNSLLLYVVAPCIILSNFQMDWDVSLLLTLGAGTLAMLGSYILYALLVPFLFRREEPDLGVCLRFGSMYGNVGFMGIPLVAAVLGGDTVIYAVLAVVVFNLMAFTHGTVMMGGRGTVSAKTILTNPVILSVAAGLCLMLLRLRLPAPVMRAVDFIGDLNTPLAMIVIGAQLSRANLPGTFREGKLYRAAAVKLIAVPILTALVLRPFPLDPTFYTAIVILAGAPTGGFTAIFAERYHRDVAHAAQLVSLCTLLSVFTLPFAALLAEALA